MRLYQDSVWAQRRLGPARPLANHRRQKRDHQRPTGVDYSAMNKKERQEAIKKLQKQMHEAAELLDFELAAQIRDMVLELKSMD